MKPSTSIIHDIREYIFPIFSVPVDAADDNKIFFDKRKYLGTGFFVTKQGDAITACHVIPTPDELEKNHKLIAVVMHEGNQTTCWINKALKYSDIDLALIGLNLKNTKYLKFSDEQIYPGQDVNIIGYPSHSTNNSGLELRFLKGHVTLAHSALEINVPIPAGMSGAPVTINDIAIGVATGRVRSEELIESFEEEQTIENNKEKIKIVEVKNIIYYGLAMPFIQIKHITEPLLNGRTLHNFIVDQNS